MNAASLGRDIDRVGDFGVEREERGVDAQLTKTGAIPATATLPPIGEPVTPRVETTKSTSALRITGVRLRVPAAALGGVPIRSRRACGTQSTSRIAGT